MKKKYFLNYILVAIFILFISIVLSVFIEWILNGFSKNFQIEITDMTNCVITAMATCFVLYELRENKRINKRENDIKEAEFMLQYNQAFIQDENMAEVERLLEKQGVYGDKHEIINEDNRQKFVNYLVYLEGLAPLVLKDVLKLEYIDDLMAYRFFLAINNPEVQKKELFVFPNYYKGCFKLYKEWSAYRKKTEQEILLEESALDKWEDFYKYSI